jgi:GT2 family glycosyltransferase
MVTIGLIVPVYKNFPGFAELMESVDMEVRPFIIPNWRENLGVSAGWNIGLKKARNCDVAVVCNDDIVLHPGTLHKLFNSIRYENWDLVTPVNNPGQTREYGPNPDFACFAVQPETFVEKFGLFETFETPFNNPDIKINEWRLV